MSQGASVESLDPNSAGPDTLDAQTTPHRVSATSPLSHEASMPETMYSGSAEAKDDVSITKMDSSTSSKIKKKFSELDIRGAMADLDIRKGSKRGGVSEFYIELEEPLRMFWCPGDVIKGTSTSATRGLMTNSGHVYLILDKPVRTQFVTLKLTGLLSVSMLRDKVEYAVLEDELVLWGTRIYLTTFDQTYHADDATPYDTPKKHKDDWDTGIMEEGEHPFPFEFDLPAKSLPSSINVGNFQYTLLISSLAKAPSVTLSNALISAPQVSSAR
jgi:hypothetical protein